MFKYRNFNEGKHTEVSQKKIHRGRNGHSETTVFISHYHTIDKRSDFTQLQ